MKNFKGQNTIEYILFVVAVLLVCIYFFTNGPMKRSVNASLYTIVNEIDTVNSKIIFPHKEGGS
ncbi:MAG: hypothetical protein HQL13_06055 [Candidatus Omnitrophica bacterium]|nr:hypothetical protein [Candidatus Omnitrophota bacterium]